MIKAEIVAHSLSPQGDELISVLCTFPRIILAEVNTHRMLSKNTSSSRAIPFKKMVESVQNDPFVPLAWQKAHSGMQGSEYWTEEDEVRIDIGNESEYIEDIQPITEEFKIRWLEARDKAVNIAIGMNDLGLTKQLCNRLLEPFMWTTMLITGPRSGWDNFFNLRNPSYQPVANTSETFRSKKDAIKRFPPTQELSELDWFKNNKGQAEIHIMDLAEKIYDTLNESTPKQLKAGEWHIPFEDKIDIEAIKKLTPKPPMGHPEEDSSYLEAIWYGDITDNIIKISTAMAARTSYTVVGDEKGINYQKMIELHDRLLTQNPPHSSPMEHCAKAMSSEEYYSSIKGNFNQEIEIDADGFIDISTHSNNSNSFGWCRNFKGFIPYRHIIETT